MVGDEEERASFPNPALRRVCLAIREGGRVVRVVGPARPRDDEEGDAPERVPGEAEAVRAHAAPVVPEELHERRVGAVRLVGVPVALVEENDGTVAPEGG